MSIWVVVVALTAVPLPVMGVGARAGLDAAEVFVLAEVAMLGPVLVLAWRLADLAGVGGLPQPSGGLPWVVLGGPALLVALAVALAYMLPTGLRQEPRPVGRCDRCAEALFTDRTGRRHLSRDGRYLCPPALRAPGDRRHHLVAD